MSDVIGVTVDVTDEASIAAVFDALERELGVADVLVNGAGINLGAPTIDTPIADWNKLMAVNLTGTFAVSRAFARHYRDANPVDAVTGLANRDKASCDCLRRCCLGTERVQ